MNNNLEVLARILGWSTIFGIALALIWFGMFLSGAACEFKMFDLTPHECAVISYGGIGLLKMLVYTFFLIPWIAVRMEIARSRRNQQQLH